MEPKFFKTSAFFRKWLEKNHDKQKDLWVGFYKAGPDKEKYISYKEAYDQALCFGWTNGLIKDLDPFSYGVRFIRRREGGGWSGPSMKRFLELKKKGLAHKAGIQLYENRNKKKSEEKPPAFSARQLRAFKANKAAWDFFSNQTRSYRRYTTWWVVNAQKEETKDKRLEMLISDSARGSKLQRIVDATNKIKKKYEPGKTPVEEALNIGPTTAAELRSIGLDTVEKLKSLGWEEAFTRLCGLYPNRVNLNMLVGLIGAVEEQDWRKIDGSLKAEARAFLQEFKRGFGL